MSAWEHPADEIFDLPDELPETFPCARCKRELAPRLLRRLPKWVTQPIATAMRVKSVFPLEDFTKWYCGHCRIWLSFLYILAGVGLIVFVIVTIMAAITGRIK